MRQTAGDHKVSPSPFIRGTPGREESLVCCPVCGFDYARPFFVRVSPGGYPGGVVRISAVGVHTDHSSGHVGGSGRGVGISVGFVCESGHVFAFNFDFHKGQTFTNMVYDDDNCGVNQVMALGIPVIWRD